MQVARVGAAAAAPEREAVAGQRARSSRATASAHARGQRRRRRRAAGARPPRRSAPARSASAPTAVAQHGARAALGHGEHPRAPAVLGRRRGCARGRRARSRRRSRSMPTLGRARRDRVARRAAGGRAPRPAKSLVACSRGALGGAHALDLGGDQRGDQPQQRRARARRPARGRAGAACPTGSSATRSSSVLDARPRRPAATPRRRATGRRRRARSPRGRQGRGSRRAAARRGAHDLGEAGARLDGVGDGVQRAEIEPGRRILGRRGHARIVGGRTLRRRPAVVEPDDAAPPRTPSSMKAATT